MWFQTAWDQFQLWPELPSLPLRICHDIDCPGILDFASILCEGSSEEKSYLQMKQEPVKVEVVCEWRLEDFNKVAVDKCVARGSSIKKVYSICGHNCQQRLIHQGWNSWIREMLQQQQPQAGLIPGPEGFQPPANGGGSKPACGPMQIQIQAQNTTIVAQNAAVAGHYGQPKAKRIVSTLRVKKWQLICEPLGSLMFPKIS